LRARCALARTLALLPLFAGCGGGGPGGEGESAPDGKPAPAGAAWFVDATARAGLSFRHEIGPERRYWFPEIMGGGVGCGDVDGDGRLDVYAVQSGDLARAEGGAGNRLFHNEGGKRFTDVTESARVGDRGYGMGCSLADADGDGRLDVFVTNVGANALYQNEGPREGAAVVFAELGEAAGVAHAGWGTSSAFFDYDLDGDLDLFVVNYLNWESSREIPCSSAYATRDYCSPNNYNAPAADVLYRNEGGLRFRDVSRPGGIADTFGNGLGVVTGDFDGDGRPDVYVANDLMANQLWIGGADGTFRERALLAGCAVNRSGKAEAGMGVVALDVEGDGDLDLFLTHLREESNTFYRNGGGYRDGGGPQARFVDETAPLGLSAPSFAFTGFGVAAADFDLDGFQDLYVANGRVTAGRPLHREDDPFAEPNQLFRGGPEGRFEEVLPRGGEAGSPAGNGRGVAAGDFDDDGDVDLVLLDNGGELRLLENVAERAGGWISLRLLDAAGRDALGARVAVGDGEGRRWRAVRAGEGYCSSHDPRVHFGLGSTAGAVPVEVRWMDGTTERFGPLEPGRLHHLRAGGELRSAQTADGARVGRSAPPGLQPATDRRIRGTFLGCVGSLSEPPPPPNETSRTSQAAARPGADGGSSNRRRPRVCPGGHSVLPSGHLGRL